MVSCLFIIWHCDTGVIFFLTQCILIYAKEEVIETGWQVTLETSRKCSV